MKSLVWPLTALASMALILILYLSGSFNIENSTGITMPSIVNAPVLARESTTPANTSALSTAKILTQLQIANEKIAQLENALTQMRNRISTLEQRPQLNSLSNKTSFTNVTGQTNAPPINNHTASELDKPLLLKAGVNDILATDIMLRYNHTEMEKLEIRDDAIRGGYLNKPQYYKELREVEDGFEMLRKDISDTAYDQILFATGHDNRVTVNSIIPGSPAELAGLQENDIITTYANQPVFGPIELKDRTAQGQRGEYVSVNVVRDGNPVLLMIPRGPLGIRLGTERIRPDSVNLQ